MSLSFEEFANQIRSLNLKGIENLKNKGVTLNEDSTTEDIINS